MKVVIIAGGKAPLCKMVKQELIDATYLICADSGANCLYEYNINPDFIVGDLDSIDKNALQYFRNTNSHIIEYPPEKDYTDTEIAILKAKELGATDIVMLGSTGTRVDHLLGNLGMLLTCLELGIEASIKDEHNTITIKDKASIIKGKKGKTFSLLAYCNNVKNLTIKGAKYPLNNYYLKVGSPLTISNEFVEEVVEISFDNGILLVIYPED